MQYTVQPLSPALAETFVQFFDALDFCHAPNWATCYCRYYQADCSEKEWGARPGEHNRAEALNEIRGGSMKGYLAFDGGQCIGWCNANDICAYSRLSDDIAPYVQGEKTGCTICYVSHPDYRNQGVARSLLKAAVEGFRADGYDAVLALPVDGQINARRYRGTMHMYEELGFQEVARIEDTTVMRLGL